MVRNQLGKWAPTAAARALALLAVATFLFPAPRAQNSASPPAASSQTNQPASTSDAPARPRGKKLILKDGGLELVREYEVKGDRVRYYSLDTSQWEEMPAALVDWDATKKVEAEEAQRDASILAKVHTQEQGRRAEAIDIDASLEVAPGIFLPPGEALFVFDGRAVLPLSQAETSAKLSKGHLLEQVLVPVPVVPTRHTVSIQGPRAKFRVKNAQPEFYMRTADAREPEMELIRAKVHGESRQIENLDELFGEHRSTRDTLSLESWQVARGVYRFTLGQPLPPGEYVFAEIVHDQEMSLYVWDFGVDGGAAAAETKPR